MRASRVPWLDAYVDDIRLPGMAYATLVRSTAAHARIRSIDLGPARATPGVIAAIDGSAFAVDGGLLHSTRHEPVLARERVRYAGEPLAAVVATTPEASALGAARVEIALDPLPGVWGFGEASVALHASSPDNVLRDVRLAFGPVDEGFARAHRVYGGTYHYGASTHAALEPHGAVAWWRPEGRLWLWSSTQCPHLVQHELARLLGLQPSAVRVITPRIGGGFGGKSEVYSHEVVAAKLSMLVGRPVRLVLSREEVFYTHRGRHQATITVRMALDAHHRILALDADIMLDGGAYGGMGLVTTYYAGQFLAVPYRVGALRFRSRRFFTTKPPAGPKRGHGGVQVRFAIERLIDEACLELGLDPVAWRREIALGSGEVTVNGLRIGSNGFGACLEAVARATEGVALGPSEAIGVAGSAFISGAAFPIIPSHAPHAQAVLRADRSGLFTLTLGVSDMGQGAVETLRLLAAEALGQEPQAVAVLTGDTDLGPVDLGSYSSRVTLMNGHAVLQAARRVRECILRASSQRLKVPPEALEMVPGRVVVAGDPRGRGLSLAKAIACAEEVEGMVIGSGAYTPSVAPGDYPGGAVGPSPAFSFSAAAARVRVDPQLGTVTVRDIWIAHDCGRAVHPQGVRAQLHGCAVMALGEALFEDCGTTRGVMDPVGLLDYGVPTVLDVPAIHASVVEAPDEGGPTGAKEAGEGPLPAVVPAIANAVARATGRTVRSVPIRAEALIGERGPTQGDEP